MASMTATTTTLYKYHCPDRLHSESGPDIKSIASPIFNSYSIDQYSPRPDSSTDSRLLACQPTNCDLLTSPSNTTLAVASNNHHHHHHLNTTPVQSSMGDQQHFSMAQSSGKWKESVEQVQNGPIHTLGQLETLARKECIKEIESACNLLQISADPYNWSMQDVHKWLQYVQKSNNLASLKLDFFRMNGMSLCTLNENDFKQRAPVCGDILHAKLEIWKMAVTFAPEWNVWESLFSGDEQQLASNADTVYSCPEDVYSCEPSMAYQSESVACSSTFVSPAFSHCSYQCSTAPYACGPSERYNILNYNPSSVSSSLSTSSVSSTCLSPAPSPGSTHSSCLNSTSPSHYRNNFDANLVTSDYGSDGILSDDDEMSDDDYGKFAKQSAQMPTFLSSAGQREQISRICLNPIISENNGYTGRIAQPSTMSTPSIPSISMGNNSSTVQCRSTGSHIHLWQFLRELLETSHLYGNSIRWLDRTNGVFKIEDSVRVARLWGARKNRPAMNYDKLSRSIRQYYKKGIMKKTERSQRLVYQFCSQYCP